MARSNFVPLRNFSAYTMLDGAIDPKKMGEVAKERGFPAIALTDRIGLFAAMAFDDSCRAHGVQPITGTMLRILRPARDADGEAKQNAAFDWLALYAQNETGYNNLCKLVSASHLGRPIEQDAHIDMDCLASHHEGLLALTAGNEGAVTCLFAAEQDAAAQQYLSRLQEIFPDRLYIELSRREDQVEEAAEPNLIKMAMERNLPMVATNPACFAEPIFHQAHDAMKCIAQSTYVESDDREKPSAHLWIKSAQVMEELFADIPEALENTVVIAQRCAYSPPRRAPILPSLAGDLSAEIEQLKTGWILSWM